MDSITMKELKLHTYLRWTLRRAWLRYPARTKAYKRQRLKRGVYLCETCKQEFTNKQIEIDHTLAVGPTPGSRNATENTSWDTFINRMFCDESGLQILCKECHKRK